MGNDKPKTRQSKLGRATADSEWAQPEANLQ